MYKKSKHQRVTALLLAIMLVVALSACGKSSSGNEAGSGKPENNESSGSTTDNKEEKNEPAKPAEVVTLQVFSMPANTSGLMGGWFGDMLKEKVGVKLDLLPSGDQGDQKLQALMAGGELPDIVVFKTKKQVEDAVRAGMLVNLDEHMDKLPNVAKNAPVALQYYRESASNGTGKAYAIPNLVGPSQVGGTISPGPMLRWDLYKKLNMPVIKEIEDYLPVLKQMQDLEPKNKDGQKVYAISLFKDWDSHQMTLGSVLSDMMGIQAGDRALPYMELNLTTGETKSTLDPNSEYIRALKFFYTANQMGLVDPDSLTQRWDTVVEKMSQDRILFSFWAWFSNNLEDHVNAESPWGYEFVPFDSYKGIWDGDNNLGKTWAFAISSSTKHLDAALKYVDFMYSTDGLQLIINGPKGVIWDINEKGQPYVTDQGWDIMNNDKELPAGGKLGNPVNAAGLSGGVINPETKEPIYMGLWDTFIHRNPSKLDQDWANVTGYKTQTEMLKGKNMFVKTLPAQLLIPTMPDEISTTVSRVSDIVKTNSWLAIFAKNETEFNKYIDEMRKKADALGIQKVLDWDGQAWKQAQADAEKYK